MTKTTDIVVISQCCLLSLSIVAEIPEQGITLQLPDEATKMESSFRHASEGVPIERYLIG
jgi:hypothetical protein